MRFVLLATALLLVQLADVRLAHASRVPFPYVSVTLRASSDFTAPERTAFDAAADALDVQSEGRIRIKIVYSVVTAWGHKVVIHKRSSLDADVEATDLQNFGPVYAWVEDGEMYWVADRIPNQRIRIHVAMHELLHVIGVKHVKDEASVMNPSAGQYEPPIHLTSVDIDAIASALECETWGN